MLFNPPLEVGVDDYIQVYNNIQSICDTYEKRGLLIEAMTRRLVLVEESVFLINVDGNFDLRWKELLKQNLDKATKTAGLLKHHPDHAEKFFNLA